MMGNTAKYWFKQKSIMLLNKEQRAKEERRLTNQLKSLLKLGYDGYGDRFTSTGSECEGIEFTPELENTLKVMGFVRYWDYNKKESEKNGEGEAVYDTTEVNGKTYLYMLYIEATNVGWKGEFEEAMYKFKVPIQKWMAG